MIQHRILEPNIVGELHYKTALRLVELLQRNKELQDIIAILGMEELSDEDKLIVHRSKEEYNDFYLNHFTLLNNLQGYPVFLYQ